jgi:chromosome transmission fidelity protein 18
MELSSPQEPNSLELAELYEISGAAQSVPADCAFSDDLAALYATQEEDRREKTRNKVVVQHRTWKTKDIFRSDPREPGTSSPPSMAHMASSPPLTPSPQKKRKFADLDFGSNQLARPPKAQRMYYGINIHRLLEDAQAEESIPKAATDLPTPPSETTEGPRKPTLLWTEKYRARKFTDLIGDERTHRSVMQWLKRWDQIVFPGSYRPKPKAKGPHGDVEQEKPHRKILVLTGPPGLGKTTLAHVCAKQAGYEVQEINASDERSGAVVKGRIRDMVGTENVKGVDTKKVDGKVRKAGKPVCVIVDEVDGVVGSGAGGGGGGEGGFIKALIDLVLLDQRNSAGLGNLQQAPARKRKGDRFRLLRPLILICNDVYHPSLRPLRQSSHAEIIHMRKPQLQTIVGRMQNIFAREGIPCETDGVRRLCEATWGVSGRKEDRSGAGAGEGDMRGIMVVAEWVAGKLRAMSDATGNIKLTRRWVEDHVLQDLAHGGGAARGLGRGGPKDIVERVFKEGAGFPKSNANLTPAHQTNNTGAKGVAEGLKRTATERLRQLLDTHGDTDRIMTDCFSSYPNHPFQDDTLLSKPDSAYEWLHFHDSLSSHVFGGTNDWELAPYLSTPVLAFHHLFATPTRAQYANPMASAADPDTKAEEKDLAHPFMGPQASWAAHEATKTNENLLQSLHASLSLELTRAFKSTSDISTDLLPYLLRMLTPNITPVVVGGSAEKSTASVRKANEQTLVQRSVNAMAASGVRFERTKVNPDDAGPGWQAAQWIYRMEPPLDVLGSFETGGKALNELIGTGNGNAGKQRYAIRQVLDQEWKKEESRRAEAARLARFHGGDVPASGLAMPKTSAGDDGETSQNAKTAKVVIKRDFFGRPIAVPAPGSIAKESQSKKKGHGDGGDGEAEGRVWVTYHEGFSNAVKKAITLAELMKGL